MPIVDRIEGPSVDAEFHNTLKYTEGGDFSAILEAYVFERVI
jgi:hypothetical protein